MTFRLLCITPYIRIGYRKYHIMTGVEAVEDKNLDCLVLLSGGLDSLAVLNITLKRNTL